MPMASGSDRPDDQAGQDAPADDRPDNRPYMPKAYGADRPGLISANDQQHQHRQAEDHPADNQADARWMSFAELAKARGISKLSAAALVRRHRWRRMRDNRGHVLALVPRDGPELRRPEADNQVDNRPDDQADAGAPWTRLPPNWPRSRSRWRR